jgi:metal-dependent amidase/aminoacylase/carboxypeptidase family protein
VEELRDVIERVKGCAEAAAKATGATMSWQYPEKMFFDMRLNTPLIERFEKNFQEFGGELIKLPNRGQGSIDIANLSHHFPSLHGYVSICDTTVAGHTKEFRDATMTEHGKAQLLRAVKTLALIGAELISDPDFLKKCQETTRLMKEHSQ